MLKKYYKGLLFGGLFGGLLSFLGFLNEISRPFQELLQIINLDFRYFSFRPCLLLTQCHGENCMPCFFYGPVITIIIGALIGWVINFLFNRLRATSNS